MERLTFEGNFCDIARCTATPGGTFCEDEACSRRKVWERLKQYEDTGLEPEEISEHEAVYHEILTRTYGPMKQKISKWLKADKEGLLMILPCKVGDKIHDLLADYTFTVERIELGHKHGTLFRCGNPGTEDYMAFYESEIGERVEILLHEEAEKALEGGGE